MTRMLLVVEGEVAEVEIFKELFSILGFTVIESALNGNFTHIINVLDDKVVYLIPGPKSQIQSMLETFNVQSMDLSLFFGISETIPLNYIIYDVDSANYDTFKTIIPNFCSPQEGLVLLSNPCIEVIADKKYLKHENTPKKYKSIVRKQLEDNGEILAHESLLDYIIRNVIDLMIEQVKRNELFFGSKDVIDHVLASYDEIDTNIFTQNPYTYNYSRLFTVVYVVLADIFDVTKSLENTDVLIKELMKYKS